MRLLVVEDQADLNEIITRKLKSEHYSVDSCLDGNDALDYIAAADYDGIILDVMLPGITGIGILRKMRSEGNDTPVLLLTALGSVDDRVAGLDEGADDYLVKPFDFDELLARIRAMIRRGSKQTSSVLSCRDLSVDTSSRIVTRGGKEIELTAKEFNILEYLLRNQGKVLSKDKLSTHVWNFDYDGGSNVIEVYMHHLRKKIDGDYEDKMIKTIKGAGYVLK